MKKLKSLLSLMLVMILMLSVAGPMAFADGPDGSEENPYTVTVTVFAPVYSPSEGKYMPGGYAVTNDQTNADLLAKNVVPNNLIAMDVSSDNTTATTTVSISAGDKFEGRNNKKIYQVSKVVTSDATVTKPVLTITPDVVCYDADKKEYFGKTATVTGSVGADVVTCSFVTSVSGNSVSVTPTDVKVVNGNKDVANRYFISSVAKTFNKPTFSILLADPAYNAAADKYEVSGAADHTVATIKLADGNDYAVTPTFDVNNIEVNIVDGSAVATMSESEVQLSAGGAVVTEAFDIEVKSSSYSKKEVHIYPNSPVNGKANGYYALNKDGSAFTGYNVYATVYIDSNGVANIDRSSVQILNTTNNLDYVDNFDVKLHTASNDGAGSTTPSPSPSTPPTTTPVTKTKLVIQAVDAEKAYNGYAFTPAQARGIKYADNTGLLAGHKLNTEALTITYTRRYDGVNFTDYTDVYKVGTYDKKLSIAATNVILDAANNDVTSQYDISAVNGILTIYNSGWVSPDTGDYTNMTLWIVLLAVSAVAVAAVVVIVLKKNKKK